MHHPNYGGVGVMRVLYLHQHFSTRARDPKEREAVSTSHCNPSSGQMTPTKGGWHGIGTILAGDA